MICKILEKVPGILKPLNMLYFISSSSAIITTSFYCPSLLFLHLF